MRNDYLSIYLLFLNFLFVNNIIMAFDGKTVQSRIKKFTNAKLLSELPFFEKP